MRAGVWAAGLAGSLVANAGLAGFVWAALLPDPLLDQPTPEAQLDVDAYTLDRDAAVERPTEGEALEEARPDGATLDPGAIPQSQASPSEMESVRADPVAPNTESAASPVAKGDLLAASAPRLDAPAPVAPAIVATPDVAAPRAEALAAGTAIGASVSATAPVPDAVDPTLADPEPAIPALADAPAVPQARPATARAESASAEPVAVDEAPTAPDPAPARPAEPAQLAAAAISGTGLHPARPAMEPALAQEAPATSTPAAPASGERVKATLAFPGGDGQVDPVSLAAFQSFVQPGDAPSAEDLRDGIGALLAGVPCSRLQVAFDPDTATLQVNGHLPEDDLRAPVLAALQAQMGADIAVSDRMLVLPRPQCGALSGIASVGLAQSTDQITNPLLIGEDTHARVLDYVKGDRLTFDITAPDYDAFIYVDYFDAEGTVLHLAPNEQVPLTEAAAKSAQRVGARAEGEPGLSIFVGPPYGQEMAVAFAASHPLYDGLRPIAEPAAPYLQWLKARVAEARADHPDFKGEWVYFFVTTAEN